MEEEKKKCNCGENCTCGCQYGKECTCDCECGENCDCEECDCSKEE